MHKVLLMVTHTSSWKPVDKSWRLKKMEFLLLGKKVANVNHHDDLELREMGACECIPLNKAVKI